MKPATLSLSPRSQAWLGDVEVTITAAVGVDRVLVELSDGAPKCVSVAELSAGPEAASATVTRSPDLAVISSSDWDKISARAEVVRNLVEAPRRTKAQVKQAAESIGVSYPLLYKLMARLRKGGGLATALLPLKSGPQPGSSKLSAELEAIIKSTIADKWLNRQQGSMEVVIREVDERCRTRRTAASKPHNNSQPDCGVRRAIDNAGSSGSESRGRQIPTGYGELPDNVVAVAGCSDRPYTG